MVGSSVTAGFISSAFSSGAASYWVRMSCSMAPTTASGFSAVSAAAGTSSSSGSVCRNADWA